MHLALELFKLTAKVDLVHVPYKGGGPALTALIAGEVQVSATSMPPAEFGAVLKNAIEKWRRVIREAKIRQD